MSHVKLAIRVRPFTEKELKSEKSSTLVVKVIDEKTVTIRNIKVSLSGAGDSRERVRQYDADYIFDSACPETSLNYASQEKVFNTIGRQVLASVCSGLSACVLAYGQSATGKTYTMMGTETQPGLIPRLCVALGDLQPMDITVSFLEIYNERVHDLLASEVLPCNSLPRRKGNSRKDLRVREHPHTGPYVQNLRRVRIHDVESLLSIVSEGKRRRRTAATRRNCSSSRSHAVLELTTPLATLQLVDLAGSEKAAEEGYRGCRQKEGANINKSLVALSNVISALVSGGAPVRFVPYRDSALTWLLKDCFTGGATTFIIATVSPSIACYGESASTLRWAARTRQLPPKRPNTAVNVITKAALQAQYNQILKELTKHYIQYVPETGTLLFDENHWSLNNTDSTYVKQTIANIGNIMNFSQKTGDHNLAPDVAPDNTHVDNHADIAKQVNKEIDKMFGPALERTRSGTDFEIVAPIRHKKRQYRSQEVLSTSKTPQQQSTQIHNLSEISQSLSEERLDEINNLKAKSNLTTSILYDNNKRAEIVASVTDRLYSKLKKNEETFGKVDANMDKKIVQPLNELKICTNARQRLMEISQKALKNKRKIGIPAYTQTKKFIIRVKDQEIDVQNELLPYESNKNNSFIFQRDVGTETISFTPRYKEVGVGSEHGTLHLRNSWTMTDNREVFKHSGTMTSEVIQNECHTQTFMLPPPRRKRRPNLFSRYMKIIENSKTNTTNTSPIININVSPVYNEGSDSRNSDLSTTDDDLQPTKITPPDLLTNHRNLINPESSIKMSNVDEIKTNEILSDEESSLSENTAEKVHNINQDFPNTDDITLPRVSIDSVKLKNQSEMKDMILGRNVDMYPYNISISPMRERNESSRAIRFLEKIPDNKSDDFAFEEKSSFDFERSDSKYFKELDTISSDSTIFNRTDRDLWRWKRNNSFNEKTKSVYTNLNISEHKNNDQSKNTYKTTKAKLYKEFLGIDREDGDEETCLNCAQDNISESRNERSEYKFKDDYKRVNNFSAMYHIKNKNDPFHDVGNEIQNSCKRLELAVNKYEDYLDNYRNGTQNMKQHIIKTPTKYLQHLIEIRKGLVKKDKNKYSSNTDVYRSKK